MLFEIGNLKVYVMISFDTAFFYIHFLYLVNKIQKKSLILFVSKAYTLFSDGFLSVTFAIAGHDVTVPDTVFTFIS